MSLVSEVIWFIRHLSRIQIEALPDKEKEKIFDYIDMVIRDTKSKKLLRP
jgi:hypothetical protein